MGDYRDATSQYSDKIYSRNVAHRQSFVSNFAQNDCQVDKCPESSKIDPPALSGNTCHYAAEVSASAFDGVTPSDWATKFIGDRQKIGSLEKRQSKFAPIVTGGNSCRGNPNGPAVGNIAPRRKENGEGG